MSPARAGRYHQAPPALPAVKREQRLGQGPPGQGRCACPLNLGIIPPVCFLVAGQELFGRAPQGREFVGRFWRDIDLTQREFRHRVYEE